MNAGAVRNWLIAEGYNPKNIQVIANGIMTGGFEQERGRASIREELGLAPDVPLIAMVSRLNRLKGAEYFLYQVAFIEVPI